MIFHCYCCIVVIVLFYCITGARADYPWFSTQTVDYHTIARVWAIALSVTHSYPEPVGSRDRAQRTTSNGLAVEFSTWIGVKRDHGLFDRMRCVNRVEHRRKIFCCERPSRWRCLNFFSFVISERTGARFSKSEKRLEHAPKERSYPETGNAIINGHRFNRNRGARYTFRWKRVRGVGVGRRTRVERAFLTLDFEGNARTGRRQ